MNPQDMHPDDLIGVVKLDSKWRIFSGTVAEWILDYASYDPMFDPSRSDVVFRDNLLSIDNSNATQFLEAMAPYELDASTLKQFIDQRGGHDWQLSILIDFDRKLYINSFTEIPLHQYVPDKWIGLEDEAIKYAPFFIKEIWRNRL